MIEVRYWNEACQSRGVVQVIWAFADEPKPGDTIQQVSFHVKRGCDWRVKVPVDRFTASLETFERSGRRQGRGISVTPAVGAATRP